MGKLDNYINIVSGAWRKTSCEKMIAFLESLNFRFVEFDHISERFPLKGLPENHYRFMVRVYEFNDDPKKDIYDYNLIWAIDLFGGHNRVFVWLFRKKFKTGRKKWDKPRQVNFKPKKKGTKYPDWMSIQDRIDYRRIEKKMVNRGVTDEEREFFNKCYPAVKEINT